MSNNLIKGQKLDREIHHEKVSMPVPQGKAVSRLRETGHVPYRCKRSYKTTADGGK